MPSQPNLLVPLSIAGAALAAMGVLRLTRVALRGMPIAIALAVVAAGAGVAATGAFLHPAATTSPAPTPAPARVPAASDPAPPAPTPKPVTGSVSGTIRTAAGAPVAGASVTLHRYDGTEESATQPATTDAGGTYAFSSLAMSPTTAYAVSVEYEATTFRSDLLFLDPEAAARVASLIVASPTTDASALTVTVDSLVLVGDAHGAQAIQVFSVLNGGDRAYVGGLRMPLLANAAALDPRSGLDRTRLDVRSDELVSSAPVLPGPTQIVYSYAVPMPSGGLAVHRSVRYPTTRLSILAGGRLALRTPLHRDGRVRIGDGAGATKRTYESASATRVNPGTRITAVARPKPTTARTMLIAGAIVLALAAVAYPLVRRRRTSGEPEPAP